MNRYDVVINGVRTILLLSDADAKARGLKQAAPPNKSRTPANKGRRAQ